MKSNPPIHTDRRFPQDNKKFPISIFGACLLMGVFGTAGWAADPFGASTAPQDLQAPKDMAFDQTNWKRPQGVFSWITMARGYETPWDSLGRPGWMTSGDAYVEPVDPGISEFTPETEKFYIVFEGQPLDAPGQFAAAWFEMEDGQASSMTPVGRDVIELEMNQRYGYFIISKPSGGWKKGKYQVKIYYGSPGQELHAVNVIGTMEFTIKN